MSDTTHSGTALAAPDPLAVRSNKLDLLERLADGLAHEIKNPLHSMVINLEVLKRRIARLQAQGGDDVLRYAGVLGDELDRVTRRIELLLRLARPDRASDETTLNELAEELMELVQVEARHRDARVEYQPSPVMTRVRVARQPARQVILNLVLDALDALPPGGTLRVGVETRDGHAVLAVSGGAPADPGADRLAVAAALAEALGGRVEAEGTERTFTLPATTAAPT
ncbi:MAG TPA: histidine kinase dimerization/phospho-acceptor domain-containing protein [Longimicrobium sp.]|nr:histidine kinase dimerization/phospho-acceptor domain-containing protein [Longimicrobium sp.]